MSYGIGAILRWGIYRNGFGRFSTCPRLILAEPPNNICSKPPLQDGGSIRPMLGAFRRTSERVGGLHARPPQMGM